MKKIKEFIKKIKNFIEWGVFSVELPIENKKEFDWFFSDNDNFLSQLSSKCVDHKQ